MIRARGRPASQAASPSRSRGATVFALATVASSWAVRWVTNEVIVPRFEEGHVATATVLAGAAMIVAIGIVRSVGVVVRRTWAGRTQFRVLGTDARRRRRPLPGPALPLAPRPSDRRAHRPRRRGRRGGHGGAGARSRTRSARSCSSSRRRSGCWPRTPCSACWRSPCSRCWSSRTWSSSARAACRPTRPRSGWARCRRSSTRASRRSRSSRPSAPRSARSAGCTSGPTSLRASKVRLARLRATFDLFLDAVPSYANVAAGPGRRVPGRRRRGDARRHHQLRVPLHAAGLAAADHRLRAGRPAPLAGRLGPGPG